MKFRQFTSTFDSLRSLLGDRSLGFIDSKGREIPVRKLSDSQITSGLTDKILSDGRCDDESQLEASQLLFRHVANRSWVAKRRPFYNIYPKVLKALMRTSLDMTLEDLKIDPNHAPLVINAPVGHEIKGHHGVPIENVQIAFVDGGEINFLADGPKMIVVASSSVPVNKTIPICPGVSGSAGVVRFDQNIEEVFGQDVEMKMAVGVLMLAQDKEFTTRILLDRDKGVKLTGAKFERAKHRAIRAGVNGYDIGQRL